MTIDWNNYFYDWSKHPEEDWPSQDAIQMPRQGIGRWIFFHPNGETHANAGVCTAGMWNDKHFPNTFAIGFPIETKDEAYLDWLFLESFAKGFANRRYRNILVIPRYELPGGTITTLSMMARFPFEYPSKFAIWQKLVKKFGFSGDQAFLIAQTVPSWDGENLPAYGSNHLPCDELSRENACEYFLSHRQEARFEEAAKKGTPVGSTWKKSSSSKLFLAAFGESIKKESSKVSPIPNPFAAPIPKNKRTFPGLKALQPHFEELKVFLAPTYPPTQKEISIAA